MYRRLRQARLKAPDEADLLTVLTPTDLDAAGNDPFKNIKMELQTIRMRTTSPMKVADYQPWCPVLARYSFHTRSLAV